MAVETPNAPLEQRQSEEPLVNGDVGAAQAEIVRRLSQLLPESITAENDLKGWTGIPALEIPIPKKFGPSPAVLTSSEINQVLVAIRLTTRDQGGGGFRNDVSVVIYVIDERARVAQQMLVHWRRAELIRRDLLQFLNGCVNAVGQEVWRSLAPTGISELPSTFSKDFSGVMCTFNLIQPAAM